MVAHRGFPLLNANLKQALGSIKQMHTSLLGSTPSLSHSYDSSFKKYICSQSLKEYNLALQLLFLDTGMGLYHSISICLSLHKYNTRSQMALDIPLRKKSKW